MTTDLKRSGLTLYDSSNSKKVQIKHLDAAVEVTSERTTPVTNNGVTINWAKFVYKAPVAYEYMTSDGLSHISNDVFADVRQNSANIALNNTTSINAVAQLQSDLAAETVSRVAGDTTLTASLNQEITRATNKETANESLIQGEIVDRVALGVQLNSKIDSAIAQEITDRESNDATNTSLINAERVRALAAEQGLQNQITNVLSNTDASALDSLSELLAKMTADNLTLTNLINSLDARLVTAESTIANHLSE